MEILNLKVEKRAEGKARDLLNVDYIPAVYYGKGVENVALKVPYQAFRRVFRNAGYNTVVELDMDGKKMNVLIHDLTLHPVTNRFTHIDFINVRMNQKLEAKIPLEFTGSAPAVRDLGGTLVANLDEVEVRCLPKDLVHSIEVNIDSLTDFNASLHVSDIKVPAGIEILDDAEMMVVTVAPPQAEEPEETAAPSEGTEEAAAEAPEQKSE